MSNPPATAALAQTVPLLLRTFPLVPGAANVTSLVPAPSSREFAVSVATPVPPCATLMFGVLPSCVELVATITSFVACDVTDIAPAYNAIGFATTSEFQIAAVMRFPVDRVEGAT